LSFEDLVEKYYSAVRRHLEERGIWEETVRRFPPAAVRSAVERILERLDENNVDPELLDWGALFEGLKDYGSVEAFIKDLEAKRYIPASVEEAARASADEVERELLELLEAARAADPGVLERLRSRLDELLGRSDELMKLRAELAELKRAAHRDRALVEAYSRRVKELEAQLARLRAEAEALRREAARPPAAPEVAVVWRERGYTVMLPEPRVVA
jgi:predicted RNase H-like nuclease (RuvC/YqgF family)